MAISDRFDIIVKNEYKYRVKVILRLIALFCVISLVFFSRIITVDFKNNYISQHDCSVFIIELYINYLIC